MHPLFIAPRSQIIPLIILLQKRGSAKGQRPRKRVGRAHGLTLQTKGFCRASCTFDWRAGSYRIVAQYVQAKLISLGIDPGSLLLVQVPGLTFDELQIVQRKFPNLRHVVFRPHLRALLSRPKVLDILAAHAVQLSAADPNAWAGARHNNCACCSLQAMIVLPKFEPWPEVLH